MPLDAPYLSAIKSFEGFAPTASWDYKQYSNGSGTKAAYPGETIDRDTAEQRFTTELGKAASYVDSSFPGLPDNKRAALSSLTYNAGPGWINSGLGAAVRSGDWADASNRFLQYNKADGKFNQGLADRRAKESAWLNEGSPTPMAAAFKGNQPMADDQQPEPSLSSRFIAGGPGALFGAPQQDYSWNRALTRGFASLRDDPSSYNQLSKPQEDFSLVQGSDGSMYRLNKKTGQVSPYAVTPKDDFTMHQGADGSMYRMNKRTGAVEPYAVTPKDDFSVHSSPDGTMYKVNRRDGSVVPMTSPKMEIVKIGTGPFGDIFGRKVGDKILPINAEGEGGAGAAGSAGAGMNGAGMPAGWDNSLQGPERLEQIGKLVGPEHRAAVEKYINGDTMPVGKGDKYTQWVKREAGFIDPNSNDLTFSQKRTALNDLAKATPGSHGGQAIAGLTTLEHLGEVKKAYDAVGNRGLAGVPFIGGMPGSSLASGAYNSVANSGANSEGALKALGLSTTRVGEESAKYYAGTQAPQKERDRIHDLYTNDLQPAASDRLIKQEKQLFADKVEASISQLASTLGPNHPRVLELKGRLEAALAKVDAAFSNNKPASGGTTPPKGRVIKVVPAPGQDPNGL